MSAPRVTAVVLTYDGRELLEVVLPTLAAQGYADVRTVVVDDASSDDTVPWLREHWPAVEVVALEQNVGVSAALNVAVRAGAGSEFVALLNNDLELEPTWLERLVATLDAHPGAASATGKMRSYHRRELLDGAGDVLRWSGAATRRGIGEPDRGQYDVAEAVFAPCAGAALYRSAALADVGPFDEAFVAYQEDTDWGLRAQLAGWTARYEPAALVFHMGGATTDRQRTRFNALQRRNQVLVVLKDYPARALVLHAPKLLGYQAAMLLASARDGTLGRQLGAWWGVLRLLGHVRAQRREVQARRRVRVADLDRVMTPEPYAGQSFAARLASALRGG